MEAKQGCRFCSPPEKKQLVVNLANLVRFWQLNSGPNLLDLARTLEEMTLETLGLQVWVNPLPGYHVWPWVPLLQYSLLMCNEVIGDLACFGLAVRNYGIISRDLKGNPKIPNHQPGSTNQQLFVMLHCIKVWCPSSPAQFMLGPEKLRSNPRDVEENMLRDKSSRACPQAMILADLTSSILQTIVSALPMLGWPKTDFLLKRCQSNQLSILDMPGAVKPFCARTPTLIGVTCFVLLPLCLAEDFSSFGFQGLHRNETAHRGHSQSQPLISVQSMRI